MIVVDTNVIAYLFLPTEHTGQVEKLLQLDADWAAPVLWRSEFRNILALYIRKEIIDLETACQIQAQAEDLLRGNEFEVDSVSVLKLAAESGCSAYDCEFVALAQALETRLISFDQKLLKKFPESTASVIEYSKSSS